MTPETWATVYTGGTDVGTAPDAGEITMTKGDFSTPPDIAGSQIYPTP